MYILASEISLSYSSRFFTNEFRRIIFRFPRPYHKLLGMEYCDNPPKDDEVGDTIIEKTKDIIFQMQMLFAKMQIANVAAVSTNGLTTSFGWDK